MGCASAELERASAGTSRVGFEGYFWGLLKVCLLRAGKTAQHGAKEWHKGRKSCVWNNHLLISRASCLNPLLNRENNALLPISHMAGWAFPVGSFFLFFGKDPAQLQAECVFPLSTCKERSGIGIFADYSV